MSLAAHIVVFSTLGLVPPPSEVLAMEDLEMEVIEPEPAKVEPPPEPPPPPPEPEPEKKPQPRAQAPEPEPEPPPEQQAPPPEEVADFTGVTLTADGAGAGWATRVGTGAPLKGPVGKIGRALEPVQQAAKALPAGPRFVPVGSLARKPQPPAGLDSLLKKHYPRRAELQGIEGKALLKIRLLPNGRLGEVKVLDDSPAGYGFASACIETLHQAPPFGPARDRGGEAVSTEFNFNCDFEVSDY